MSEGGKGKANLPDLGETRDKVASQLGASATQLRKEQSIEDHREVFTEEEFAIVSAYNHVV